MDQSELVTLLTDAETSLFHDAYFGFRLEEEFKKSRRFGWPLSLVIMEVGGLDALAEGGGARARSSALLELANTILSGTRSEDITGRLGPARFGMLLPNTPAEGLQEMAHRVMSTVLEGCEDSLSLCVGASCSPQDDLERAVEFQARAEKAVEVSRGQGRNQLVIWTAPSA